MSRNGKTSKPVENLVLAVLQQKDEMTKNSNLRHASSGWGAEICRNVLHFYHYGTCTLQYDLIRQEILYYYGESRSDSDSLNTILDVLRHDELQYFKKTDGSTRTDGSNSVELITRNLDKERQTEARKQARLDKKRQQELQEQTENDKALDRFLSEYVWRGAVLSNEEE